MINLKTIYKTLICKIYHKNHAIPYDRKTRLVDSGMRKEIVAFYQCGRCGRKWKEYDYV